MAAAEPMAWEDATDILSFLVEEGDWESALMWGLGIYTGYRIGDILRVTWIDLWDGELVINEQKTGKRRSMPLTNPNLKPLIRVARRHQGEARDDSYVFHPKRGGRGNEKLTVVGANKRLKSIVKRYGHKEISSHSLRKTFGRRFWELSGKTDEGLITLAHLFNHSDTTTTRRYIGLMGEMTFDLLNKM